MAGRTSRFGFNTFGGSEGGSISDDGFKFSSEDRESLDSILAAIERHDHRFVNPVAEVEVGAPDLALGTEGNLEGGVEYFYRVALLDEEGIVGFAGDESSIVLPDLLSIPDIPVVANIEGSVVPGTLSSGVYYYGLTALRGFEESPLSATVPANVSSASGSVRLELPDLEDAEAFSVWRKGPGELAFTRVAGSAVGVFVDDGSVPADPCAGAPGRTPPDFNVGGGSYSVTVMLPAGVQAPHGWVIYRSETSGFYDAESVVEVVTAYVDELDPGLGVVGSWVDDGDPLVAGSPRTEVPISFSPLTVEVLESLPDSSIYPVGYLVVSDGGLFFRAEDGSWAEASTFTVEVLESLPDPSVYPVGYLVVSDGGLVYRAEDGSWAEASTFTVDILESLPDPSLYPVGYLVVFEGGLFFRSEGVEWVKISGSGGGGGVGPIFTSPNGSRFVQGVDDSGAVTMTPTVFPGPPAPVVLD